MKAILEFNLPEDQEEFKTAQQAVSFDIVLHEIDNWLRSKIKYAPDTQDEATTTVLQEVRDKLHHFANTYNVEI